MPDTTLSGRFRVDNNLNTTSNSALSGDTVTPHELTIHYVREGATNLPPTWQVGFDDDGEPRSITVGMIEKDMPADAADRVSCTWCNRRPKVDDPLIPMPGDITLFWMHQSCIEDWHARHQLVCGHCGTDAMRHHVAVRTTTMYVGPLGTRCGGCSLTGVNFTLCALSHLVMNTPKDRACESCNAVISLIPCAECDISRSRHDYKVCDSCRPRVITSGTMAYHIPDHSAVPWHAEFPVGLEIEAEHGARVKLNRLVFESTSTGVGSDASLPSNTGVEARLAPLNGGTLASTITVICDQLTQAGYTPTKSAGIHGHVWAGPLRQEDVGSIVLYASAFDDVIHGMMPPSRNGNQYAEPVRPLGTDVARMMSMGNTLSEASVGVLQHSSRYIHVNTQPYWLGHPSHQSDSGDGGNKTIEWRLHSASLNPTKIHNWARIIRGMTMHAGQFKVDADEWAAQPLSPEKVGAFLKGIEQDDLFDYVMQRVIKFEKKEPQRGSQLEMTYDIGKMEGSLLWVEGKELTIEESETEGGPPDEDCEHEWYNETCESCGTVCDHRDDSSSATCGHGCQYCYTCSATWDVGIDCEEHN